MEQDDELDPEDEARAVALLADLERLEGKACGRCAGGLCGHELVASVALGFKSRPYCLACLAAQLEQPRQELRARVLAHVLRQACFRQGWGRASAREANAGGPHADGGRDARACAWGEEGVAAEAPAEGASAAPAGGRRSDGGGAAPGPAARGSPADDPQLGGRADATWDAGDMSCGDLVLALRRRLLAMEPGAVLALTASDPAAPEDIPAWCGLTGHTLLRAEHPRYWIRRRPA